jgi:hypothetical protein
MFKLSVAWATESLSHVREKSVLVELLANPAANETGSALACMFMLISATSKCVKGSLTI